MPDYADVWSQYQVAIDDLYDLLTPAEPVTTRDLQPADASSRADTVIAATGRLASAAAQGIVAPRAADRERSTLQLVAGAAADLAVANDLIRAQGEAPTPTTRGAGATYSQLMTDLGPILRPGAGPTTEVTTRSVPAGLRAASPDEALAQLRGTATRSFDAIAGDVVHVGQMALSGLVVLPAAPIKDAAAVVAQEILNKVGDDVGPVLRRATQLLIRAYDKILAALGEDSASEARVQAANWIDQLQSDTRLEELLTKLYTKQRILEDIEKQAKEAGDTLLSDKFSNVLVETRELAERFQKQRKSLEWILRGLAFAKDWLFSLQPWGPLAVTAMYVGTLGYSVYAGGDYVDWYRTERIEPLNRIPGLRDIVRETLISPEEDETDEETPPEDESP